MSIEVEVPQTTISNKAIEVEYSNSNTAIAEGTKELEVTVNRREYNIVGDELYIPKRYEDAPQWLRDIIDTVTNAALSNALSDVSTLGDMLDGLIAELNVAKNTYTMSIISDNDINERINTAIETLNSSLADADSTILDIAMTRVTPEEAQAIAIGILSASINGGDIAAAVQNLQSAIADVDSARALDYTRLNASIGDEFESTATAINTINAYVGIDEAGASTGTGLSAYLEDSNGVIGGADSQLNNTIKVTAEGIESKFAYNSVVNINGVYKKSGFGLTTNYTSGSGTAASPYVSEFWIDASRLKFTNSNQTGKASPFTIDATGTTPKITFNGLVTFGSGQSGTIDEAIAAVVETVSVGDKNINITDNLIPVTSFVADTDNSGYQLIGNPVKSISAGYDNYSEAQLSMDSNDEAYSPYVDEMNSSYYYRFAIKGITSLNNFKIATISAANAVTYAVVTVTMNSGQTLSSTSWYLVDGLINPYGGNTSANGSIRNSSGTKIGTINNFVLPSSANKMVLGWLGTAIISRMKLCTVTADTIMSDFTSVNATLVANQTQIDTSTQLLADMANDNKLTPSEKSETLKEWTRIQSEKTLNTTQAATYSVTSTAYTTAYNSLSSYVTPILSSMSTTSDIVGTTFRSTFKSYYDENTQILNAIATKISANATTYTDGAKAAALLAASDAQTTANTAVTNAATANSLLADIASDSKLTPDEKISTKKEWDILVSEYSKNTAQATTYSVSSTAYTTAYNALNIYLTPLLSSLTATSVIVGTTFRSNFKAYYDARTDLLNAIATKINANAQSYANSAVSNIAWQSEVQAAINNNATYIDGGKIVTGQIAAARINTNGLVADTVRTYALTAWNTTIENGLITNAKISDGAITNAKIGDAQITTAKIGDLSVSTLKIQDEAVIVPRSASGSGTVSIVYTTGPTPMNLLIFASSTLFGGSSPSNMSLYVNSVLVDGWGLGNSSPGAKTTLMHLISANVNTTYIITCTSYFATSTARDIRLVMMGVKK